MKTRTFIPKGFKRMKADYMEMPCQCDCGNWFDLDNGYTSRRSSKVICDNCHGIEEDIEEIENQIDFLEGEPNKKREVNKLKKRLQELEQELF